mmetsp:Transcript_63020/g.150126  ORF Transcript_63020/g.150126 Transcript_63020/m.150126 type:complete len:214 (-) Transcript_63020:94-735(-)
MAGARAASVLLPLALLAAWLTGVSRVFVQPLLPAAPQPGRPFGSVDSITSLGPKKKGDKWERKFRGILPQHAPEEFLRGKGKFEYKEFPEIELPEDGVKLYHVEYEFTQENVPKIIRLNKALQARWGDRVRLLNNDVKAFQMLRDSTAQYQPPRVGSFEVVDMHTKEVVFSKLATGLDMFYSQDYLTSWLDKLKVGDATSAAAEEPVEEAVEA